MSISNMLWLMRIITFRGRKVRLQIQYNQQKPKLRKWWLLEPLKLNCKTQLFLRQMSQLQPATKCITYTKKTSKKYKRYGSTKDDL